MNGGGMVQLSDAWRSVGNEIGKRPVRDGSPDAGVQDGRRGRTCERPLDGAVDAKADTDAVVAQGQRAVTAKRAARVRPTQHRGREGYRDRKSSFKRPRPIGVSTTQDGGA